MEYKKNDIVTVAIEDVGSDGEGIGKVDGFTLFIKDAVMGDTVEAKIIKSKKHYAYARLEKVVTPSPFRVEPQCAYYRQCGGCQIQALSYEKQLEFKQNKIRNNLIRIGSFNPKYVDERMEPIVGMEEPFHYRNKAQYPVGTDKGGNIVTGFYAGRTHSIIANTDCGLGAVVNKEILEILLNHMKKYHVTAYDETTGEGLVRHVLIRTGFTSGEIMVCFVVNYDNSKCDAKYDVKYDAKCDKKANKNKVNITGENMTKMSHKEFSVFTSAVGYKDEIAGGQGNTGNKKNGQSVENSGNKNNAGSPENIGNAENVRYEQSAVIQYIPGQEELIKQLAQIEGMTSVSVSINTAKTNVIMGTEIHTIWGDSTISDTIHVRDMQQEGYPFTGHELTFKISPLSFYQVNPVQTEKLYSLALEYAGLTGQETVWDLYCGIGTISLFLANKAKQVYGVEIIPQAIEDAKENAARNGIKNAEFFLGKAEEVLPEFYHHKDSVTSSDSYDAASGKKINDVYAQKADMRHPDVIVVDPPRKGCDQVCLATMLQMHPKRIVYVSCDSATLARDLRVLCDGGYEIEKIRGVDQFAQTVHVETVALLSLKTNQPKLEVTMEVDSDSNYTPEERATYQKIKAYVKEKYGVNVHTSYIAQVKRMCGLDMGENYNKSKKENPEVKQCPQEKVEYIKDALEHYNVI